MRCKPSLFDGLHRFSQMPSPGRGWIWEPWFLMLERKTRNYLNPKQREGMPSTRGWFLGLDRKTENRLNPETTRRHLKEIAQAAERNKTNGFTARLGRLDDPQEIS